MANPTDPPLSLWDKQCLFARLLPVLLTHAHDSGYEITLGDAYRDPRAFGSQGSRAVYGEAKSAHKHRLAIDLNLFKGDDYLPSTEAHRFLGEFWESLHPSCVWGGRFRDGNHYSIEHQGIK
jgi:hypothetical protein